MEKQLTIANLAPYLAYGIDVSINGSVQKMNNLDSGGNFVCFGWGNAGILGTDDIKPILRPLSHLTRSELEAAGFNTHIDFLTYERGDPRKAPFGMIEYLFKNHYDVFGLIDTGLAIEKGAQA